jgi:hypothetical protein
MPRQKASAAMPTYQCLLIDYADQVEEAETMRCGDDNVAPTRADGLLARHSFAAVEIWDAGRCPHRAQKAQCQPLVP